MKVSIVMSVYNTPTEWLKTSINSILNQTHKDFEFIIVDDGSTSNEVIDTILDFKKIDNRIHLIKLFDNSGIAACLNIGIEHASTNTIFRMDSDDISYPDRLEKQIDFLDKNPEIDVLGGAINYTAKMGDEWVFSTRVIDRPYLVDNNLAAKEHFLMVHPTVVFKKDKIQKIGGYDKKLKGLPEDFDLWIRCLSANYVLINQQEPVLTYRINDTGLSANFNKEASQFVHDLQKKIVN